VVFFEVADGAAFVIIHDQVEVVTGGVIFNRHEPEGGEQDIIWILAPIRKAIWGGVEEFAEENYIMIIEVDGERVNLGFHHILEEVRSEGWFGRGANFLPG